MSLDPISQQRLDELAGVRGARVADRAAVRKADVAAIVSLAPAKAVALSSAPTAADYNLLLADFQALRAAIDQIAAQVKP
jgi:hypothetical protein